MHPLFYIPELILHILESTPAKRDALHFGLTCKAIWGVVEGEIWGQEWDQSMLFSLVPESALEGHPPVLLHELLDLQPHLKWDTIAHVQNSLVRYSTGLRRLTITDSCFGDAHRDGTGEQDLSDCNRLCQLLTVLSHPSIRPYFDHVRAISFTLCPRSARYCRSLLSSSTGEVSSITIRVIRPDLWQLEFLYHFLCWALATPDRNVGLNGLEISTTEGYGDTHDQPWHMHQVKLFADDLEMVFTSACIFARACHITGIFGSLTELDLICSDGLYFLSFLGRLPCLRSLKLRFYGRMEEPFRHVDMIHVFPALESLSMDGDGVLSWELPRFQPDYAALLRAISSPDFKDLDFFVTSDASLLEASRNIAEKWPTTFEGLRVVIDDAETNDILLSISPLAHIKGLLNLTVFCEECLLLDDDAIKVLVGMFPSLIRLQLSTLFLPQLSISARAAATALSLCHITNGLPMLRHLIISVDFDRTIIQDMPVAPAERLKSLDLEMSHCSASSEVAVDGVAGFINELFPSLQVFAVDGENENMVRVQEILSNTYGWPAGTFV